MTERLAYLDSSALVKLALEEPESGQLAAHVGSAVVTTSEVAIVEVSRACKVSLGDEEGTRRARDLLRVAVLLELDRGLLERAAGLANGNLRSLDAIHLAAALAAEPDELVAYDRRLLDAAEAAGLTVASPGA
ncbi:MAG: type II toxin-antitoxin system VapC family toxin [Thermoleophilia bacterium]|nr:type II toxin-antitoxin system VapC family toxin [Thermoleophilia bacterium]